jgi:hypothetical protein
MASRPAPLTDRSSTARLIAILSLNKERSCGWTETRSPRTEETYGHERLPRCLDQPGWS